MHGSIRHLVRKGFWSTMQFKRTVRSALTVCLTPGDKPTCTSQTQGARPPSDRPIYHTQVNLLIRMPDGNNVEVQCHYPPIWATCFQPELGSYPAKINGHN